MEDLMDIVASKVEPVSPDVKQDVKQAVTEMKTAFGSPHPDPVPEPPAAPTPEVNPAKQLDFTVGAPPTPSTPALVATAGDEMDYNVFIIETLLWTNKLRSVFYFVAGFLGWLVVRGVFTSSTTLFTGLCYTLLFSLAFNFLRGALAPRYQERCTWSHSAWTRFFTAALTTAVSAAAAVHDAHLNGLDALRTLEVGLGLWVLSLAGRALDAVTLLLLLHVGAFTVPLAYKTYKAKIDRLVGDVYGKAHQQYERLDRRVRATVVLVPLLVLFFMLPLIDRFVAFFICLAYGRVWAKPDEYLAVQRKALEPLGKALTSALTPATTHAAAAMAKYDITPTPTKKKAN